MAKIIDITNERFGSIVVIENTNQKDQWGKTLWKCQCDCGNIIVKTKSDIAYKMKSCGCLKGVKISQSRWQGHEEISKTHWSHIIHAANVRKIKFEINIEEAWELFLSQNRRCALTGLEINFSRNTKKTRNTYEDQTASLDRIDSKKGYVKNNIQWLHKKVNLCKHLLSNKDFIYLCRLVVDRHK